MFLQEQHTINPAEKEKEQNEEEQQKFIIKETDIFKTDLKENFETE